MAEQAMAAIPLSKVHGRLGQRVKDLREKLALSQTDLALASDVQRDFVARIEAGTRRAQLETLEKIAGALGVGLAELFAGPPVPARSDRPAAGERRSAYAVHRDRTIEADVEQIVDNVRALDRDGRQALVFVSARLRNTRR